MKWNRKRRKAHQKRMRYLRRPLEERRLEYMAYVREQFRTPSRADTEILDCLNEALEMLK